MLEGKHGIFEVADSVGFAQSLEKPAPSASRVHPGSPHISGILPSLAIFFDILLGFQENDEENPYFFELSQNLLMNV